MNEDDPMDDILPGYRERETRPRYYSRQGRPLTEDEWVASFGNMTQEARVVAFTGLDEDVRVSTVWLGLDHSFLGVGPPLIFETMIFGGTHDGDQWRYSTEEQAVAGHAAAVEHARCPECSD